MICNEEIFSRILKVYDQPSVELINDKIELRKKWFIELLRRMKLWSKVVVPKIEGPKSWFFDVMNAIDSDAKIDVEIVKEFCKDNNLKINLLDQYMIAWWLNWCENRIELSNDLILLPCPFEPFEVLLELGGAHITRDGTGVFSAFNISVHPGSINI